MVFFVDIVYLNEVIVFYHCNIAHVEDLESLNLAFELTERNEEVSVHQKLVFRHSIVIAELKFLDITAELVGHMRLGISDDSGLHLDDWILAMPIEIAWSHS